MDASTSLDILQSNKLMRSDREIAAFENALAELAKNPQSGYLQELHFILDDKCQHQEVMFSLVHFLESFDVKEQLDAFIDVLPQLVVSAPEWTKIIHDRIINDDSASVLYKDMLNSVDSTTRNVVSKWIDDIQEPKLKITAIFQGSTVE